MADTSVLVRRLVALSIGFGIAFVVLPATGTLFPGGLAYSGHLAMLSAVSLAAGLITSFIALVIAWSSASPELRSRSFKVFCAFALIVGGLFLLIVVFDSPLS